ncbi:hypothetical protein SSCG_03256 [Streptomyces clavuligerus]|nr:hypothetical protein SSCG_03256 [Streptomyces clavuligerus]
MERLQGELSEFVADVFAVITPGGVATGSRKKKGRRGGWWSRSGRPPPPGGGDRPG